MISLKAFVFHAWVTFGLVALVYAVLATEYKRMLIFKEPIPNKALLGHVIRTEKVADEGGCRLKCYLEPNCVSINVGPKDKGKYSCELNNATDESPSHSDLEKRQGYTHIDVQNYCHGNTCPEKNTVCQVGFTNSGYRCACREGYTGEKCEDIDECQFALHNCEPDFTCVNEQGSFRCDCHPGFVKDGDNCKATGGYYQDPAQSCKDIRNFGSSKEDGDYWIDPAKNGNPLEVYCDMTTDGGGWLLVSSFVMKSLTSPSPSQLPVSNSYRGISSKQMLLTKTAMNELRRHLHFTQLRFNCKKQHGGTFHITTAANNSGEAVVQYFSGQTDVQPDACGSFLIMDDDNSSLARACQNWGFEKGFYLVGKWGHGKGRDRLYNHAAFVAGAHHWIVGSSGRWEWDDFRNQPHYMKVFSGDFWKVFFR